MKIPFITQLFSRINNPPFTFIKSDHQTMSKSGDISLHKEICKYFPGKYISILDLNYNLNPPFTEESFIYSSQFTIEHTKANNTTLAPYPLDQEETAKFVEPVEQPVLIPILALLTEDIEDTKLDVLDDYESTEVGDNNPYFNTTGSINSKSNQQPAYGKIKSITKVNFYNINYLPIVEPLDRRRISFNTSANKLSLLHNGNTIYETYIGELMLECIKKCKTLTLFIFSGDSIYLFTLIDSSANKTKAPSILTIANKSTLQPNKDNRKKREVPTSIADLLSEHCKADRVWTQVRHGISGKSEPSFFIYRLSNQLGSRAFSKELHNCIFCLTNFGTSESSIEHIIPKWNTSLISTTRDEGNNHVKSHTGNILCNNCNHHLGRELEDRVQAIILGPDTHDNIIPGHLLPWVSKLKDEVDSLSDTDVINQTKKIFLPTSRLNDSSEFKYDSNTEEQVYSERLTYRRSILHKIKIYNSLSNNHNNTKESTGIDNIKYLSIWSLKNALFASVSCGANIPNKYFKYLRDFKLREDMYIYLSLTNFSPDNDIKYGVTYFTRQLLGFGYILFTYVTPNFSFIVSSQPYDRLLQDGFIKLFPFPEFHSPSPIPRTTNHVLDMITFHANILTYGFGVPTYLGSTEQFRL